MFFFHPLWLLLALPGLLLGMWAQMRVRGAFNKYSRVGNARNMTGAQAAAPFSTTMVSTMCVWKK